MLLDGAIRFATQGRDGLARKDYEACCNGLSQCRAIVLELLTTIRPEADPALAGRVRALYTFLFSELVEAGFEKDAARLDNVIRLLQYERESWDMLLKKLAEERAAAGTVSSSDTRAKQRKISVEA